MSTSLLSAIIILVLRDIHLSHTDAIFDYDITEAYGQGCVVCCLFSQWFRVVYRFLKVCDFSGDNFDPYRWDEDKFKPIMKISFGCNYLFTPYVEWLINSTAVEVGLAFYIPLLNVEVISYPSQIPMVV